MKRTILAAALLGLAAVPAFAADDTIPNPLGPNWQALQTAAGNLRNSIVMLANENGALQQEVATLRQKCGDRCAPPQAKAEPATPAPAKPEPAQQ